MEAGSGISVVGKRRSRSAGGVRVFEFSVKWEATGKDLGKEII